MPTRSKKKLGPLAKLGLTGGSLLISFLVCEVAARSFLAISVVPFLREHDADTGTRYKKNLSTVLTYPEFSMRWSTNSRGFRSPEPPDDPDGCVLIFGDSYSEGWGVHDEEVYARVLQDMLDRDHGEGAIPVINASMSATGNGRWLKLMQGEFADHSPRLVVLQVCWNDTHDNLREKLYRFRRYRPTPTAVGNTTELMENPPIERPFIRTIQPFLEAIPGLEGSHIFSLVRNAGRTLGKRDWQLDKDVPDAKLRIEGRPPQAAGKPWLYRGDRLFLALLEHSIAVCNARGWPVIVMSVRIGDTPLVEIQRICERMGATLMDIRNREARPDLYYEHDSHWNPAGHRFVAGLIHQHLQN